MFKTSEIFLPLYFTVKVSLLYLFPLHTSHLTYTSGRKCISTFIIPSPSQASHLPPLTLKLNLPGLYPLALASWVPANSSLIGVNIPVYVTGLDLGVLPIGLWLISITLSTSSVPSIFSKASVFRELLLRIFDKAGKSVWLIRVDFPEPETPVTLTIFPRGISKSIFLRLFPEHPKSLIFPLSSICFFFLIWILFFPKTYWEVREFFAFFRDSTFPEKHTSPPWIPAFGPMSMMWSASSIVSWSCSTTITVLPSSFNLLRVDNSFLLSLWCKPIEGSSKI